MRPPAGPTPVLGPLDVNTPECLIPLTVPAGIPPAANAFRRLTATLAGLLSSPDIGSRKQALGLLGRCTPVVLRFNWTPTLTPEKVAELAGSDYDRWFRQNVYPSVLDRTQAADDEEAVMALSVLIYNDDWRYLAEFADRVGALTTKSKSPFATGVGLIPRLRRAPDPDLAYKRLLDSPHPLILTETLTVVTADKRVACRSEVKKVLDRTTHPRSLYYAMHALAVFDNDPDHDPGTGGMNAKIEPGSWAAELLEYWRNKP